MCLETDFVSAIFSSIYVLVTSKGNQDSSLAFPDKHHTAFQHVWPLHRPTLRSLEVPLWFRCFRRVESHDAIVCIAVRQSQRTSQMQGESLRRSVNVAPQYTYLYAISQPPV